MNSRKRTSLYLAGIFCAGLLTGALLSAALVKHAMMQPPHPHALAARLEKELTQKLDLNTAQQQKTRVLIDGSITRIMAIYSDTIQKIDTELLTAQKTLTSELTPEQREKLKDLATDRQDFLRKHAPMAPTGLEAP